MWEPDTLRAGPAGPGRSEDGMSGKRKKWFREGGPEGLRKAHEARAGHGPEDAGAQGVVQGDREGAGQVALDGERRGGVAQVRDGAEGQARRARGRLRRPVGGLPAPGGVAAMLQRLRPVPRDRLQAPPPRLLRGPGRAAVRRLGPRLVQARDRRRRARRGGQAARPHSRRPAPRPVARAAVGPERRARWTCRPRRSTAGSRRATTA